MYNFEYVKPGSVAEAVTALQSEDAIALSGVKETRNIALQINDGETGREVWRAVITKIVANANQPDKSRTRSTLSRGVRRAFQELPPAGGNAG